MTFSTTRPECPPAPSPPSHPHVLCQVEELNNILACQLAAPGDAPLVWAVREEVVDLLGMFLSQPDQDGEKVRQLAEVLGVEESTLKNLEATVAAGGFSLESTEDTFVF